MEWLDPRRGEINFQPAYGSPPLAVLPRLNMMPKSGDLTQVSAVLAIGLNTFSEFSAYCDTRQIPNLLYRYHADPEEFLESFFGYKIPTADSIAKQSAKQSPAKQTASRKTPELNLDDLL